MFEPLTLKTLKHPLFWVITGVVLFGVIIFFKYPGIFIKKPDQTVLNKVDVLQSIAMESEDYAKCLGEAQSLVKKYPTNKDIWQWKAICEFQLGNFAEAKVSFEKLLALDPESEVAKNYLRTLNSDAVLLNVVKDGVSQPDLEANLDFSLDQGILKFEQALKIPGSSVSPEFTTAQYTSLLVFDKTNNYIAGLIKGSNVRFNIDKQKDRTSYIVAGQKSSLDYAITIFKQIPVKVIIDVTPRP